MPKKMFDQRAIVRILENANQEEVIGAITESGLYERTDLQKKIASVIQYLPIPNIIYEVILNFVPSTIVAIEKFILAVVEKILATPPGHLLPKIEIGFDIPEEPMISYADALEKIEEQEKRIADLVDSWGVLRGRVNEIYGAFKEKMDESWYWEKKDPSHWGEGFRDVYYYHHGRYQMAEELLELFVDMPSKP